jgi:uncharacterized protein (DUF488 family)
MRKTEPGIYSIGHGRKPIELFIAELKSFDIAYLCDVRSVPYSRFNPQYNQKALKAELEKQAITYVYLGEELGGRPGESSCYINGVVSYELVAGKPFFREGLERLLTANNKRLRIAIMCSETKPEDCHRSRLIGKELLERGLSVRHITKENTFILQQDLVFTKPKKEKR